MSGFLADERLTVQVDWFSHLYCVTGSPDDLLVERDHLHLLTQLLQRSHWVRVDFGTNSLQIQEKFRKEMRRIYSTQIFALFNSHQPPISLLLRGQLWVSSRHGRCQNERDLAPSSSNPCAEEPGQ